MSPRRTTNKAATPVLRARTAQAAPERFCAEMTQTDFSIRFENRPSASQRVPANNKGGCRNEPDESPGNNPTLPINANSRPQDHSPLRPAGRTTVARRVHSLDANSHRSNFFNAVQFLPARHHARSLPPKFTPRAQIPTFPTFPLLKTLAPQAPPRYQRLSAFLSKQNASAIPTRPRPRLAPPHPLRPGRKQNGRTLASGRSSCGLCGKAFRGPARRCRCWSSSGYRACR